MPGTSLSNCGMGICHKDLEIRELPETFDNEAFPAGTKQDDS
jgi:hypothetical protein